MSPQKSSASPALPASAALIGDLVGSRVARDRRAVHRRFTQVLAGINDEFQPISPLRITVGDEYQGRFETLGAALGASLVLRVALLPLVDVRHGVGWGAAEVLEQQPPVEDGSTWWAARDAIERVEAGESRAALRGVRTAYVRAPDFPDGADEAAVNAALMTRDHLVSGLSERGLSVLRGLLAGSTQSEIAAAESISASAVSQRVRADGLQVLLAAHRLLGEVE